MHTGRDSGSQSQKIRPSRIRIICVYVRVPIHDLETSINSRTQVVACFCMVDSRASPMYIHLGFHSHVICEDSISCTLGHLFHKCIQKIYIIIQLYFCHSFVICWILLQLLVYFQCLTEVGDARRSRPLVSLGPGALFPHSEFLRGC